MNQIDLKGRVAVITGGAQGIGYAAAERVLRSGASVALWDIDAARLAHAEQVGREVVRFDRGAVAHDDGPLDGVVELADVPLPLGGHQQSDRLTRSCGHPFPHRA